MQTAEACAAAWVERFEQWQADGNPANDAEHVQALADIAVAGNLPCYENGTDDAGADGWQRLVESYRGNVEAPIEQDKYTPPPAPWET